MRSTTLSLLMLTALGLARSSLAADIAGWQTDFDAARQEAQQSNRPMLLHFYADWCFPCKRMEQDVLSRPAVVQVLSSRMILVKINVDRNPDLAKRFNVSQFPSDVIVDPQGERILASTGYQEADKYVTFARQAEQEFTGRAMPDAGRPDKPVAPREPMIALDGYCPVTLAEHREWMKGNPQITSEHRGQLYYFVAAEQKAAFDADARKFIPQLLGCDPVILRETDLAVPGSVRFGAYYDDELYLFATDENRTAFKADPDKYTRTRVVRNADEIERTALR